MIKFCPSDPSGNIKGAEEPVCVCISIFEKARLRTLVDPLLPTARLGAVVKEIHQMLQHFQL